MRIKIKVIDVFAILKTSLRANRPKIFNNLMVSLSVLLNQVNTTGPIEIKFHISHGHS